MYVIIHLKLKERNIKMQYFPGTNIKVKTKDVASFLNGLFAFGEINQTQLMKVTGLTQSTIQNWVNRGWVAKSNGKGYDRDKVARILIINMLRQTMSLDNISSLLFFINGKTETTDDDIIRESTLYILACRILFSEKFATKEIDTLINAELKEYPEFYNHRKRLAIGISVIVKAFMAASVIQELNSTMTMVTAYRKEIEAGASKDKKD